MGQSVEHSWENVASHDISRNGAALVATFFGVLLGIGNVYLDLDFSIRTELVVYLLISVVGVVFLHEGTHGAVAALLGHKPIFGIKPPLVYMTMAERVPRGHFILIALAPLFVLDGLFLGLYQTGHLKLLWNFCFAINTLGATGDVWIFLKVIQHDRGTWIQDTKTGIEIWKNTATPEEE